MWPFTSRPKKVLVSDSDPVSRRKITGLLELNGFKVVEAAGAGPAVKLAVEERPDLILMDNKMVLLAGETAVAILRAEPKTKETPIIIVSSDDSMGNVERCLAQGANDFVLKPVDGPRLLAKVKDLLGIS